MYIKKIVFLIRGEEKKISADFQHPLASLQPNSRMLYDCTHKIFHATNFHERTRELSVNSLWVEMFIASDTQILTDVHVTKGASVPLPLLLATLKRPSMLTALPLTDVHVTKGASVSLPPLPGDP